MRLAIANAKGGVAKTTTSMYLAATIAHRGGRVCVYDADPQSSASLWADAAGDAGDALAFEVRPANLSTLSHLAGDDVDSWSIVDAPPQGKMLQASIHAADFVLIPTSDSPLDLQQAWAMLDEALASRPAAILVVKAEPATVAFRETMHALGEAESPRFDTVIPKRQQIKKALGTNPVNLYEYRDLLTELEEIARDLSHGEEE
ncbi:MAG: ParA family protein [Bifidobacterium sp.]|jgi:chromosome partitioning protein|nr:ParA family protein [Bifidobacterium sp.]MCI1865031.1 ParA family protein [Bifidobacterium sp.]